MSEEATPIFLRSETSNRRYYDSLQRVGPEKPLGYLPLDTIRYYNQEDPEVLRQQAIDKGLYAKVFDEEESKIASGALYIADIHSLQSLLDSNKTTLSTYGWPGKAEDFIEQVTKETAPAKTKLFDLIADAFADKRNPGRSDIEADIT